LLLYPKKEGDYHAPGIKPPLQKNSTLLKFSVFLATTVSSGECLTVVLKAHFKAALSFLSLLCLVCAIGEYSSRYWWVFPTTKFYRGIKNAKKPA